MIPPQPSSRSGFGESQTVQTPELIPLQFACAGIGSRFLALAIDTLIQLLATICILVVAVTSLAFLHLSSQARSWGLAAILILFFLLWFGYFALFEIFWSGQTPGKRKIGLRVIKETGRPLSPTESLGRNLMRIVDQVPVFYGIGIIAAVLSAQNKRLGDFVAGSIVVRESSVADLRPKWRIYAGEPQPSLPGTQRLTLADLTLIESFLQRRNDMDGNLRSKMASDILQHLSVYSSLNLQTGFSAESVLETLREQGRAYPRV